VYHFLKNEPVMLNPEGYFELIFQLHGFFRQSAISENNWQVRPDCFIGGLHNRSFRVEPEHQGAILISVNFKPHCARFFIPDKLNLFKNKIVRLDEVYKRKDLAGIDDPGNESSIEKAINTIEKFLLKVYRNRPDSPVERALSGITSSNGFINITQLAQHSCLSPSQLRKRFNEEVGMSPKEYSKIVRVNCISQILAAEPTLHLTELTYRLGYFDQAHFIKDFKSVTGISPKKYLQ
jgi:AraC-like DNA-binding protein